MRIATIARVGIVAGVVALALGLVACSPSTQEFGEETDTSTAIEFTNSIGDEIVGIAYKESDDESYSDDLMGDDDSIAADEVFILNLEVTVSDSTEDGADDSTSDAATDLESDLTDAAINVSYDIQVTPASGEAFEISDIVFGDFTSAEICYSTDEELGYLVYTSESTGEEVSTLDSAIAARDAEEQAAAEAEAEAAEQEEDTESSTQESSSSSTSSSSGSSTSSGSTSSGSSSSGSSSSSASSTDSASSSDSIGSGIDQSEDSCLDDAVLNE